MFDKTILQINLPSDLGDDKSTSACLPAMGLFNAGEPLIDISQRIKLLDADFGRLSMCNIVDIAVRLSPGLIIIGYCGKTDIHRHVEALKARLHQAISGASIIYGSDMEVYQWMELLGEQPYVEFLVMAEEPRQMPLW